MTGDEGTRVMRKREDSRQSWLGAPRPLPRGKQDRWEGETPDFADTLGFNEKGDEDSGGRFYGLGHESPPTLGADLFHTAKFIKLQTTQQRTVIRMAISRLRNVSNYSRVALFFSTTGAFIAEQCSCEP